MRTTKNTINKVFYNGHWEMCICTELEAFFIYYQRRVYNSRERPTEYDFLISLCWELH